MISQSDKHVIDVVAAASGVTAFLTDSLPLVAVFLTILWTAIRIYETDTVQRILGRKDSGEET